MHARTKPSYTTPCEIYNGHVDGYIFKCGPDGVGYHAEIPPTIILDKLIPPAANNTDENAVVINLISLLAPQAPTKRVRRQRHPNGKRRVRKRRGRRQRAIDAHPDNGKTKPPYTAQPTTTLSDRWWPQHGLWSILTANPNCWKAMISEILEVSQDDFVLGQ